MKYNYFLKIKIFRFILVKEIDKKQVERKKRKAQGNSNQFTKKF